MLAERLLYLQHLIAPTSLHTPCSSGLSDSSSASDHHGRPKGSTTINAVDLQWLKSTWALVLKPRNNEQMPAGDFAGKFFGELFKRHPELRSIFLTYQNQGKALAGKSSTRHRHTRPKR